MLQQPYLFSDTIAANTAFGTHEELTARQGLYAYLSAQQLA